MHVDESTAGDQLEGLERLIAEFGVSKDTLLALSDGLALIRESYPVLPPPECRRFEVLWAIVAEHAAAARP